MKKLTLIGLLAMFAVAGCADVSETPGPDGAWTVENNDNPAQLGCVPETEPVWSTTTDEPWYVPGRIEFSQNDGLFVMPHTWMGRSRARRTVDGATYGFPTAPGAHALDKSWDLITRRDPATDATSVVRRSTGEVVAQLEPADDDGVVESAEIAASGRTAAAVTCIDGQSRLVQWSLGTGELTGSTEIGPNRERCTRWNGEVPLIFFGPAERSLVVAMSESGALVHMDLETGEQTTGRVELAADGEQQPQMANGVILDAHVGPNGRQLLLSTSAGRVEVRRLPDFARVASFESTVETLNEMTYAPPVYASPVAWAPDGRQFVSLSAGGDVVARNLDGEILQSFPGARNSESAEDMWGMEDSAVALAFSHDGTRLVVGHYFGTAMYACENASFPRSEDTFDEDVRIEGPSEISTSAYPEWTAHVDGHEGAVSRFLVDGEEVPPRSDGLLTWRAYEPGTYELAVEFDDGRASGRATMTVVATEEQ
ncbi:MAG: WD40 repeat domain-containing protein [Myxococcota bacterium]